MALRRLKLGLDTEVVQSTRNSEPVSKDAVVSVMGCLSWWAVDNNSNVHHYTPLRKSLMRRPHPPNNRTILGTLRITPIKRL